MAGSPTERKARHGGKMMRTKSQKEVAEFSKDLLLYTWSDLRPYVCPEYMALPIMRHVRIKCVRNDLLQTYVGVHMSLIDIVDSCEQMLEPELLRTPLFVCDHSSDILMKVKSQKNSSHCIFHRYKGTSESFIVWFQGRYVAPFFQIDRIQAQQRFRHSPDLNPGLFEDYSLLHKPCFKKECEWENYAQIAKESKRLVWKWRSLMLYLKWQLQYWELRRLERSITGFSSRSTRE